MSIAQDESLNSRDVDMMEMLGDAFPAYGVVGSWEEGVYESGLVGHMESKPFTFYGFIVEVTGYGDYWRYHRCYDHDDVGEAIGRDITVALEAISGVRK